MILAFVFVVLLVVLLIAIASSVALLWVKIVCWIIVAAIAVFVLMCWWINSTWGREP
jgi:hypothetical protein